jgi:hypothetical protein
MQSRPELPEDVRAEIDLEERRQGVVTTPGRPAAAAAEPVPEDVLSEEDLQARVASQEQELHLAEGRQPAEEEDR